MRKFTTTICLVLLYLVSIGQSEYYLTVPEVQQSFRNMHTLNLVINNVGPPADIRYQWLDVTTSGGAIPTPYIVRSQSQINTFAFSPIIPTGTVTRVHLRAPRYEPKDQSCSGSFAPPFVYDDSCTPDYNQPNSTGVLHVYSTTSDANFQAYFEIANGAYDDIFSLKGEPGIASMGDTVILPGQNLYNTDNSSASVPSCHTPNNQAAYIGNIGNSPVDIMVYPNANGYNYNSGTFTLPGSYIISIPPRRTIVLNSLGLTGANNIGGTFFEVISPGSVVTTFEDAMMKINQWGLDPAGDVVPTKNYLEKKYFIRSGIGSTQEFVMIYPSENSTNFTVRENNGPTSTFNGNLGNGIRVPLPQDKSIMICSDKDILVYQSTGSHREAGMTVVPGFGCKGSKETFLVSPANYSATDNLFITLFTVAPFHNDFTIEMSPLGPVGGPSQYHDESTTWTDITNSLSFGWTTHNNTGSAPPSQFRSARVLLPSSLITQESAIRVTNDRGIFQMGMVYNNTSSTIKFAYLSDYDSLQLDTCLEMDDEFCQHEDPFFEVCTHFQYSHHKIIVKDEDGNILGQTPVVEYPEDQRIFYPRDEISGLPPRGTVGCFELNHIVYLVTEMCGENDTCAIDTLKRDFCFVTDLDTLYNPTEFREYCDWTGFNNPFPNKTCVIESCHGNGIARSHIETQGNFPAWVVPISGELEDGDAVWCLGQGAYNKFCYDTSICRTVVTPIEVLPYSPNTVHTLDTLWVCDWSQTVITEPVANCAEVKICQQAGISHTWIETVGPNPFIVMPTTGDMFDASTNPTWCLQPGSYVKTCYDTLDCTVYISDLQVINYQPTVTRDTLNTQLCDWSGTWNPNPLTGCMQVSQCDDDGATSTNVRTAGQFPAMLGPSSGDPNDLSTDPTWCLPIGSYVQSCYYTDDCLLHEWYINMLPDTPAITINQITLSDCDWSNTQNPNGTAVNCIQLPVCSGPGITGPQVFSAGQFPVSIPPTNNSITNPEWCLPNGSYVVECYDNFNCQISRITYNVVINQPSGMMNMENYSLCDWSQTLNGPPNSTQTITQCGGIGLMATTMRTNGSFPVSIPTATGIGSDPTTNPTWELPVGSYVKTCYFTDCTFLDVVINITSDFPTQITSSLTLELCPSEDCIDFFGCNSVGVVSVTLGAGAGIGLPLLPITGTTNPYNSPVWCLSRGMYTLRCFNEDCTEEIITITVQDDETIHGGESSIIFSCEEIVTIGEEDLTGTNNYQLLSMPGLVPLQTKTTGQFGVNRPLIGGEVDYAIKYIGEDGCFRQDTITVRCEAPCLEEFSLNDYIFDKTYFAASNEELHTRSTFEYNGNFYSVMNNATLKNSIVLKVTDSYGNEIGSREYLLNEEGLGFFAKEIQVVNEGIYVIANTEDINANRNTTNDNSRARNSIQGVLMRINHNSLSLDWVNTYLFVNTATAHANHDKKAFFNSFVPKLDDSNNLDGFMVVGSARDRFESHTNSQIDLYPLLCAMDKNGAIQKSTKLNGAIPYYRDGTIYKEESSWAMDITTNTGNKDLKYAVLLQSRSNFSGIVGHHARHPGAKIPVIRTSYLFVDDDLNINNNVNSGLNLTWFSHPAEREVAYIPKKIEFDNSGKDLMIYIVGQVINVDDNGYLHVKEGFLHQFENRDIGGQYVIHDLKHTEHYITKTGFVDLLIEKGKITLVGENNISTLNPGLSIDNTYYTEAILAYRKDFAFYNNYNGDLIFTHPASGVLVSESRGQRFAKFSASYLQDCPGEGEPIPSYLAEVHSIEDELELIDEPMLVPMFAHSMEQFGFDFKCCVGGEGFDPCAFIVEVDFEKTCDSVLTVTNVSINPPGNVLSYEWTQGNQTSNLMLPVFQMAADGELFLKVTMDDGCVEYWVSDWQLTADTTQGITQTIELDDCTDWAYIGVDYPGVTSYHIVGGNENYEINTGVFHVPGPSYDGTEVVYNIYYQDTDGCWKKDTYILTCPCPWYDEAEYNTYDADDTEATFEFTINGCPEGCNGTRELFSYSSGVYVDMEDFVLDPTNPNVLTIPNNINQIALNCYDEDGCLCYMEIFVFNGNSGNTDWNGKRSGEETPLTEEVEFFIYPNPTSSAFNIVINNNNEVLESVKIFNAAGALIETHIGVAANTTFTLSEAPKGLYIIEVISNGEVFQEKLILQD